MKQGQQFKQSQGIKLTPQLQMAIKILQYSRIELDYEIEKAIESNPFLELSDSQSSPEKTPPELSESSNSLNDFTEAVLDSSRQKQINDDFDPLELIPQTGSLSTHLLEQLQLSHLSQRDIAIGEALIDSLNDDGYCHCSWQDIRLACRVSPEVSDQEIETVLHLIQQFDPIGVAARTLSECLLVQLQHTDCDEHLLSMAQTIANQHLDCLAKLGAAGVVKNGSFNPDHAAQAISIIKALDPKPGAAFNAKTVHYVEPDFWVEKVRGVWKLHAFKQSKLRINHFYQSLIKQSRGNDNAYMKQHLQEANWLIKSIQSRQDTLKSILKAIIKKQHAFLEQGPKALQAQTQKDIAEQIGVHDSTVSRACSNKYLRTSFGTFELRALFNSGVSNDAGTIQASTAVHVWIQELVSKENPKKPLSDSQLVNALKLKGLTVARRTVAKYRESLNIPASYLRQKNL
jgi:RNA polymerase sigma-54 factor